MTSRRSSYRNLFSWKYLRWTVAGFLLINVALFVQLHKLAIKSDNTIPVQIPGFRRGDSTSVKTRDQAVSAPAPAPWNNSIFEGKVHVAKYTYTSSIDNNGHTLMNLWDHSAILPDWMKDYFVWHREQRLFLQQHPSEWQLINYYIVECSDDFNACGGTADRLGPLPFHVRMASSMNRLMLIRWTQPAPLESFLLPPMGGLDWRVPAWLWIEFQRDRTYRMATYEEKILKFGQNPLVILLRVKYQSHNHGEEYYDQSINSDRGTGAMSPTYAQVYHDLWRICFTPVPAIAERIEEQMRMLGIQPGKYNAVHIRALYAVETRDENIVTYWARNSIRCATSRFPISAPDDHNQFVMPFLFVSDSTLATKMASEYGQHLGIRVVNREHEGQQPLHLEKTVGRSAQEFYDTFVDIYMIGMARCTAYNMGGFGRWGSMIGYNSSCVTFLKANMEKCEMLITGRMLDESKYVKPILSTPLFIPPMPEILATLPGKYTPSALGLNAAIKDLSNTLSSYNLTAVAKKDPLLYAPFDLMAANNYLWKGSKTIPMWMKKYFRWHQQQRLELLNPSNWTSIRFLVMDCLRDEDNCGGTDDRLKSLPTMIRFAAATNRLLLIHWRWPVKLEEFLLPPKGGVDWRVPEWLHPFLMDGEAGTSTNEIGEMTKSESAMVRTRFQASDGGSAWYDRNLNDDEPAFEYLFHDVWWVFFTPALPVAVQIKEFMDDRGLVPGAYASAHISASIALDQNSSAQIKSWTANGINCASTLRPGKPIFVASDSKLASEFAVEYGTMKKRKVLTHPSHPDPTLHLDNGEEATNTTGSIYVAPNHPAGEYYNTFIDAYLLAFARCVSTSKGGIGHWALLIGGDHACTIRQKQTPKGIENHCNWTEAPGHTHNIELGLQEPLFLEPMEYLSARDVPPPEMEKKASKNLTISEKRTTAGTSGNIRLQNGGTIGWNFSDTLKSYNLAEVKRLDPLLYSSTDSDLWDDSQTIPMWMKSYFQWHRQQRESLLNPKDWRSMKLFVMECLDFQERCGGTSDRLKPIPTMLRLAAMTKRFILIHWRRPAKLEEFLLPPNGGIDWRVPDWLHPLLIDPDTETGTLTYQIEDMAESENATARAKYQSFDGGCGWYDEYLDEGETPFNELFHEVWRIFFTPAPPVAMRIKEFMDNHGLVPGNYASAHVRALYAIEHRSAGQTKVWTRNGVNCASNFRPGKPIFVASDSKLSSEYAVEYGTSRNGKVVTHQNNPDPPLHLDKGEEVTNTTNGIEVVKKIPPAAYYDTFIDVYLLALAKCVFISKGGFGHWALLIGGNITCTIRQKRSSKGIQNRCNWTDAVDGVHDFESRLTTPLFLEPVGY